MKAARILWIIASFYLFIVGFVYIVILGDAPENYPERYEFIRANWNIYELQWKGEFMIAIFLAIASFIFANSLGRWEFYFIAVGQFLIAVGFPPSLSLGELDVISHYEQIGKAGHLYVNFGFFISLSGFTLLHWHNDVLKHWMHKLGFVLALLATFAFGAGFIGVISTTVAQKAMPLVILLYLVNGYYGIRLKSS